MVCKLNVFQITTNLLFEASSEDAINNNACCKGILYYTYRHSFLDIASYSPPKQHSQMGPTGAQLGPYGMLLGQEV